MVACIVIEALVAITLGLVLFQVLKQQGRILHRLDELELKAAGASAPAELEIGTLVQDFQRQKCLAIGFSRPARPADLLESAVRLLRYVGRGAGSTANRTEEEQYRGGVGHLRRCGIESEAGRRARPGFNDTPDGELAGERIHRE